MMAEIALPAEVEWAPAERAAFQRLTLAWGGALFVLFPVLGLLGLFMRLSHANFFPDLDPIWFYAALTLHGVGMVGLWFITGFSGVLYLLSRYVRPSLAVSRLSFALTLFGVLLLVIATLVGRFAAGWYFLYPLPYRSGGAWANWATDVYLIALAILGVAWTLWALDLLRAIAQRYRLSQALCWHFLRGETKPEVPPLILITTVSTIASLTGFVAAVILLAFFAADRFAGVPADPLLMKNLVFYFGHVLVNITMYLGVAMLYDVLPQYVGRPWKTTATTAFAWNAVLFPRPVCLLPSSLHGLCATEGISGFGSGGVLHDFATRCCRLHPRHFGDGLSDERALDAGVVAPFRWDDGLGGRRCRCRH